MMTSCAESKGEYISDALTQVQQLNGFVPSPALLNSPSFLAPLFQSVTAPNSNNDQTKTVTSPVLASPSSSWSSIEGLTATCLFMKAESRLNSSVPVGYPEDGREEAGRRGEVEGNEERAGQGQAQHTYRASAQGWTVPMTTTVSVRSSSSMSVLLGPPLLGEGGMVDLASTLRTALPAPQESLSVIMQAAMSGMSSLAGYSFTQLTPTQLAPYTVATSSSSVTATNSMLQQQPLGTLPASSTVVHPEDTTVKNELPALLSVFEASTITVGKLHFCAAIPAAAAAVLFCSTLRLSRATIICCSSVTSLQSESINDASTYDAYTTSESNHEMEACASSLRSSASPRSQEEHVFMGPFTGDSYDALEQEKKKLERKRARNRLAASKCRQKKLQKISDLEKQVEDEKLRAIRLNESLKLLETSITQLRQLLHEHRNNGCPISAKVIST
uniref:BZIP domain-containing protein n=1 Tax=Setaria digitata TaxID=48799 RepID=A0A915PP89_9BILA